VRGLLEELGVTRDPEWTTSSEALRAELAALSWPCSEEVLRAEEIAGGLTVWPGGAFGVHATLRLLRGDVPWDRDDMQDCDLRADPRDAGRRFLPAWIHEDPWVWLGLDGRVFWAVTSTTATTSRLPLSTSRITGRYGRCSTATSCRPTHLARCCARAST